MVYKTINISEDVLNRLLEHAAIAGHNDDVNELIKFGADVNMKISSGLNLFLDVLDNLPEEKPEVLWSLLRSGFDIQKLEEYGSHSALAILIRYRLKGIATELLDRGYMLRDEDGKALVECLENSDKEMAWDLLGRNVNVNPSLEKYHHKPLLVLAIEGGHFSSEPMHDIAMELLRRGHKALDDKSRWGSNEK